MNSIISIIVFILVLGFLISIHEFGHFIVAKCFNVYCGHFSIGMGPKIFSKKIGETNYELRALPIGGFVAMAGEDSEVNNEMFKDVPKERTIKGIKWWKKILIFVAGVTMNFISSYVIIVLIYFLTISVSTNSNQLGSIVENSPAYEANMQVGDVITSITNDQGNQFDIHYFTDLAIALGSENNKVEKTKVFQVEVMRDDQSVQLEVNAVYNEESSSYFLGVSPTSKSLSFIDSMKYGFSYCKEVSTLIIDTVGKLVTHTKDTVSQLSGPVGIYNVTSEVTKQGNITMIFELVAMLGVNLGVMNLLPIPGLDGYQILVVLVETIIGRELPENLKIVLQLIGLALVFGLMIVVSFNDLFHIF